jgi:predicted Zn-dependent peptidase
LKSEKRKSTSTHDLEKKIAFIDALIEQSKYKKAEDEIKMSLVTFSNNSELLKRKHYLQSLSKPSNLISKSSITTNYQDSLKKIKTLKNTLQRIEKRSKNDSNFGL